MILYHGSKNRKNEQQRRDRMSSELDRIRRKYRRSTQAKYFDEIIEEWADNEA